MGAKRQKVSPAGYAWRALGLTVLAYELWAPPGQLLSEEADRWMERNPWTTRFLVGALAAHLTNFVPDRVDPIHLTFVFCRNFRIRE